MLGDAIDYYHDLLTDDIAAASQEHLNRQTRQHGLFFGERPVCTVLRPRFLTAQQYGFLQSRARILMSAFDKIHRAALTDAAFRGQFCLTPEEETLLADAPAFPCPCPTARLDSFFVSENELRFTEFNAETPAGAAYQDTLTDLFYGLPVMQEFLRRYRVSPLPARPGVLHALLDSFRRWSGSWSPPRIAILDWNQVPTYSEFVLFADYFRSHGLECVIADPSNVEYRDGKLFAGNFYVTLIYKRVLISELLQRGGLNHPVVRAVRDRAVCMVNPFHCKLLYKKASLAVLSDTRNAGLFTADELRVIADHVPWSRVVQERQTDYRGQSIDLIPFVLQQRERLVLKPNDEYGGKGIVLGWTVDPAEWERAVLAALRDPYVVQERVTLPYEPYPSLSEGRLHIYDRMLDTNPFVVQGEFMDSCLTRISTATLVNVTAGGGSTVPTLIVEER